MCFNGGSDDDNDDDETKYSSSELIACACVSSMGLVSTLWLTVFSLMYSLIPISDGCLV